MMRSHLKSSTHFIVAVFCILLSQTGCEARGETAQEVLFEIRVVIENDQAATETSTIELERMFPIYGETRLRVLKQPELVVKRTDITRSVIYEISYLPKNYHLALHFTTERANDLFRITSAHVGKRLAIVASNRIIISPKVMEPIKDGLLAISTASSLEDLQQLAKALQLEPTIEHNPPPEDKPRFYKHERSPLSEEEMAKIMVSDDWVVLRRSYIWSQPTDTSSPIFLLSGGFSVEQEVQILSQHPWIKWVYQGEWIKIRDKEKTGWVSRKDLIPLYINLDTGTLLKVYQDLLVEYEKLKQKENIPMWWLIKQQQIIEMYKQEAIRRFTSEADFQRWYREVAIPQLGKAQNP